MVTLDQVRRNSEGINHRVLKPQKPGDSVQWGLYCLSVLQGLLISQGRMKTGPSGMGWDGILSNGITLGLPSPTSPFRSAGTRHSSC